MPADVGVDQSLVSRVIDVPDRGVEPHFKIGEVFVAGGKYLGGDEDCSQVGADLAGYSFLDRLVGERACAACDLGEDGSDGRLALQPDQGPGGVAGEQGSLEGR